MQRAVRAIFEWKQLDRSLPCHSMLNFPRPLEKPLQSNQPKAALPFKITPWITLSRFIECLHTGLTLFWSELSYEHVLPSHNFLEKSPRKVSFLLLIWLLVSNYVIACQEKGCMKDLAGLAGLLMSCDVTMCGLSMGYHVFCTVCQLTDTVTEYVSQQRGLMLLVAEMFQC